MGSAWVDYSDVWLNAPGLSSNWAFGYSKIQNGSIKSVCSPIRPTGLSWLVCWDIGYRRLSSIWECLIFSVLLVRICCTRLVEYSLYGGTASRYPDNGWVKCGYSYLWKLITIGGLAKWIIGSTYIYFQAKHTVSGQYPMQIAPISWARFIAKTRTFRDQFLPEFRACWRLNLRPLKSSSFASHFWANCPPARGQIPQLPHQNWLAENLPPNFRLHCRSWDNFKVRY